MTTAERMLFKETAGESDNGRPVGISTDGIIFYNFPKSKESITEVPYSQIEKIEILPESRLRRIMTTTALVLGCAALGIMSLAAFGDWLDGELRIGGIGAIFIIFAWPVLLIGAVCSFFGYFTSLGFYLSVQSGRHRGKYYFDRKDWNSKKEMLQTYLADSGHLVQFPAE